jgi:hypothetical protein
MKNKKTPPAAKVSAASALLDRGYGKAPAFTTDNPGHLKTALEMSDEELCAIARRGSGPSLPPPDGAEESDRLH